MFFNLQANESRELPQEGQYIYFRSGSGKIELELREKDGVVSERQELSPGEGLKAKTRFERIRLVNTYGQLQGVDLYIGSFEPIDNNRSEFFGQLNVVKEGGTTRAFRSVDLVAETPTKILDSDSSRLIAYVTFSGTVFLDVDNSVDTDSFENGSFEDDNQGELWAYSRTDKSIKIWESKK